MVASYNLIPMPAGLSTPRNGFDVFRKAIRVRDYAATRLIRGSLGEFGKGSQLQLPIYLMGPGSPAGIKIGSGVTLGPSCRFLIDEEGKVRIGDRSFFGGMATIFCADSVEIGEAVLIGWNVHIVDFHHCTTDQSVHIMDQGIDRVAPVKIGDGAWLGANATIMPGVTIGRNAVIGANSVVNKDVPDFATAVGMPARIL